MRTLLTILMLSLLLYQPLSRSAHRDAPAAPGKPAPRAVADPPNRVIHPEVVIAGPPRAASRARAGSRQVLRRRRIGAAGFGWPDLLHLPILVGRVRMPARR